MRKPAIAIAAVLGTVVLLTPGLAQAKWTATGSGTAQVGATTLQNASGFTSTCTQNSNKGPITLSWTAGSSFTVSYAIAKAINGVAAAPITVNAPATTYTDNVNPNKNDVFTYTIRAVVQNWTTAPLAAQAPASFTGNGGKCV